MCTAVKNFTVAQLAVVYFQSTFAMSAQISNQQYMDDDDSDVEYTYEPFKEPHYSRRCHWEYEIISNSRRNFKILFFVDCYCGKDSDMEEIHFSRACNYWVFKARGKRVWIFKRKCVCYPRDSNLWT